jgi:hypothetical protein
MFELRRGPSFVRLPVLYRAWDLPHAFLQFAALIAVGKNAGPRTSWCSETQARNAQ